MSGREKEKQNNILALVLVVISGLRLVVFAYGINHEMDVLWALFVLVIISENIYRSGHKRAVWKAAVSLMGNLLLTLMIGMSKEPKLLWGWLVFLMLIESF